MHIYEAITYYPTGAHRVSRTLLDHKFTHPTTFHHIQVYATTLRRLCKPNVVTISGEI